MGTMWVGGGGVNDKEAWVEGRVDDREAWEEGRMDGRERGRVDGWGRGFFAQIISKSIALG